MKQKINGQIFQDGVPIEKKTNEWDWTLLPSVFSNYGVNMSNLNKISSKMMGTSILATACASIGRNCHVTPNFKNPTWKERANLWGVCTAPAGSRKSEALKKAIFPIFDEQKKLHKKWEEEIEEWEEEEIHFKSKKSFFDKQLKMKLEAKQDIESLEVPKLRQRPKKKHYIATDITAERIPSFIANADGSAFVAYDEMSAFFQSTGSNNSRNTGTEARAIYLSAWSGDGFDNRLRQDDKKETNDDGASISVFGMAQPDVIADHVADYKKSRDGFLSRFQLVTYETDYKIFKDNDIAYDNIAAEKYAYIIHKLLNFKRENPFYYDNESAMTFKKWSIENELLLLKYNQRKDYLFAEVIAKRTKVICALSLIFHLVEQFEITDEPVAAISNNALEMAIKLNQFYVNEIKNVINSEKQRDVEKEDLAGKILDWLEMTANQPLVKKGVTPTTIANALRKKGERPSSNTILEVARSADYKIKARRIYPIR